MSANIESANSARVTPERIIQMAWSFAPPLIVHAAVENKIFDTLDRAPMTAEQLASSTGTSLRGVVAVADALVALQLLTKDSDQRYALAPDTAEFLVTSKPSFHGGLYLHFYSDLLPRWMQLSEIVRSGKSASHVEDSQSGAEFFEGFVSSLLPMNWPAAQALAQTLNLSQVSGTEVRVLDLAAGSGVWGLALAQSSDKVRVTAVDWDRVLSVTRRTASQFGLGDRFNYLPGNIQEVNFGNGFSVALLGHILHSEGEARSRSLLRRVFDALRPGGRIAIAEFLTNSERTGPPQALIFGVNMLVHTTSGQVFSFEQIEQWLIEIGFSEIRAIQVPAPSPLILATKPS